MKIAIQILVVLFAFSINNKEDLAYNNRNHSNTRLSKFIDKRDNQEYEIVKIDSIWWFNENLKYWTAESNCFKNVESNCEERGRLYGYNDLAKVCPENWRIPNEKDFDNLIKQLYDSTNIKNRVLYLNETWETVSKQNNSRFMFQKSGFKLKKKYKSNSSMNLWLALEDGGTHTHMYQEKKSNKMMIFRHNHEEHNSAIKNRKFAVRCVCNESELISQ